MEDNPVASFFGGLLVLIMITGLFYGFVSFVDSIDRSNKEKNCASTHNVYKCEWVLVPTESINNPTTITKGENDGK